MIEQKSVKKFSTHCTNHDNCNFSPSDFSTLDKEIKKVLKNPRAVIKKWFFTNFAAEKKNEQKKKCFQHQK